MSHLVLNVNGARLPVDAPDDESLLSVLRYRLNLTGTKYGCGEGECGACTVLADGHPIRSCQVPVIAASSYKIVTIEGLAVDGKLSPLQEAFVDHEAMQCGYCTSGMIMNAAGLLNSNHEPTPEQIAEAMNGNICRCGTYPRIVAAIQQAARAAKKGGSE